jgi:hypothetical protein
VFFIDLGIIWEYNCKNTKKGVTIMAFEVYKPRGERTEKVSVVSLSKTSLVMNTTARVKLGEPESIELAYDPETSIIRVKSSEDGIGVKVKKTKVFAKGFFNQFGINSRGRFRADYNEDTNALYISLKHNSL